MAALSKPARRAAVVAAATGLWCLGALSGSSAAQARAYPPCGGPFVVSTTLVIAGGHLTFTATLPFGEPIVVELNLPPAPPPTRSPTTGRQANSSSRHSARDTQTLATLVPDAHGRVSASVTVPHGTVPGEHELTLATTHGHRVLMSTPLRVLPIASRGTASTSVSEDVVPVAVAEPQARPFAKPLLAAGAMTIGTGLGSWALRRRRPRGDD